MRALLIIDILFQRSKLFRSIVADNVKLIAQCAGFLNSLNPTNTQNGVASTHMTEVENTVKQLLESWDRNYGSKYPQIHAVVRFCKETLGIQMPNVQANARRRTEEIAEQQLLVANVVLLKASKIVDSELSTTALQIDRIVNRVTESFAIIFPHMGDDEVVTGGDGGGVEPVDWDGEYGDVQWVDEEETEEHVDVERDRAEEGRIVIIPRTEDALAGGVPYTLEIPLSRSAEDIRTADNEVVLETIRELAGQLLRHVVPRLRQWREVLRRAMDILIARADPAVSTDSSSGLGKRRMGSDERSVHDDGSTLQMERFRAADLQLEASLRHIHDAALSKCRELFRGEQ